MFVVMSDSHTDRDVIKKIKKRYEGTASALFHCGDSELPSNDDIWQGINVVAGNCDYDEGYSEIKWWMSKERKSLSRTATNFMLA